MMTGSIAVFSHPDYTVGPGTSPDPPLLSNGSRALPPVGNWQRIRVPSPCPEDNVKSIFYFRSLLERNRKVRLLSTCPLTRIGQSCYILRASMSSEFLGNLLASK